MILQLQSAFFQASQLQFVAMQVQSQQIDDGIEVAVFDFQLDDATLYIFL
jgi:hypothetical protein